MKANFYAYDSTGKQALNPGTSDFKVTENGEDRRVLSVSCPLPKQPVNVSVAMSIDVSGSMAANIIPIPVELGKTTATDLCNMVAMPPSEFALQKCDDIAVIMRDFTTDRSKIINEINKITASGDNDFVEQLLNDRTGLLNIVKTGNNKRIAVLYTDAWWYSLTEPELQRCIDTCKKYDIKFYAIIYSRPEAMPDGIKSSLNKLAEATRGKLYDGITSLKQASELAEILQKETQDIDACTIEWESEYSCKSKINDVEVKLLTTGNVSKLSYQSPKNSLMKLEFNPVIVSFLNTLKDTCTTVTVTARNADFTVTNITLSNPSYRIEEPTSFTLKDGESRNLQVCYTPPDSGYSFCQFTFVNDQCPANYYARGGFKNKKPSIKTIKLIHPNGAEVFLAGNDTVITWEGVLPEEPVTIEYSTDRGLNWKLIAQNATGLSYKWHIPNTPSEQCLARVTAQAGYRYSDFPEVKICNQIWMGINLDVECYRNGDTIRHAATNDEWKDANAKQEGAWCYFNNDPVNGEIYGKLYNGYAVSDPRGLAPVGWHIASDIEWIELEMCLGMSKEEAEKFDKRGTVQGGKLKSTGTIEEGDGLWKYPNNGATNETGFSCLPAGSRDGIGKFYYIGIMSIIWTSTSPSWNFSYLCFRKFQYDYVTIVRNLYDKSDGFSVRCVRD